MKKNNPNLTDEQKLILFDEGTEPPGSSELKTFISYFPDSFFKSTKSWDTF